MKFCADCGAQIDDNAIFCGNCGKATSEQQATNNNNYQDFQGYQTYPTPEEPAKKELSGLGKAAKILTVIGAILTSISTYCLGFIWCIPMVLSFNKKIKRGEKISTAFKVCILLFVSSVGGILMLCDPDL